jgi:hypothetical protein
MKQLLWILFSKVSLFYLTDIGYVIQDMETSLDMEHTRYDMETSFDMNVSVK